MTRSKKPVSHFGRLEFDEELPAAQGGPSFQQGRWVPNRRSLPKLPPDFAVPFQIIRVNGLRIIRPKGQLVEFVKAAFYSGMRLLDASHGLTREQRQSYRVMNLLMSWSLSPRRMHSRSIDRFEDLILTGQGKRLLTRPTLLPDDLMSEHNGELRPATPNELISSGREFAQSEGFGVVHFSREIEFGLLSYALRSPETAKLRATEAEFFLRFSLFGNDVGEKVRDREIIELVEENLIKVLDRHLDADAEEFRDWWDNLSDLCRLLSRRRPLKTVVPGQVRYTLYDLLLRSHRYASQCIEIQMRHIGHLIQPRLSVAELRDAKLWYERQKWLSECSSIVFHGRMTLFASVLPLLSENPDRKELWPAFVQAMLWRTQILLSRRELEEKKQRSPSTAFNLTDEGWKTVADDEGERGDEEGEDWPSRS